MLVNVDRIAKLLSGKTETNVCLCYSFFFFFSDHNFSFQNLSEFQNLDPLSFCFTFTFLCYNFLLLNLFFRNIFLFSPHKLLCFKICVRLLHKVNFIFCAFKLFVNLDFVLWLS